MLSTTRRAGFPARRWHFIQSPLRSARVSDPAALGRGSPDPAVPLARMPMGYKARWSVWSVFVIVWTALLLQPAETVHGLAPHEVVLTYKVIISKMIHVLAYGLFCILSGWLGVAARYRLLLLFFMMTHAALTEWIQENWI